MNIVEAFKDARVFGSYFAQPDTWARWLVFLRALFALSLNDAELAIYQHHTGRSTPPAEAFNEALALCGRRSGKTRIAALVACYFATMVDLRRYLAPGEVARILIICPDRKQARQCFGYCRAMLSGAQVLADLIERETTDTLVLSSGVAIEICTCSSVSARGYSCPLVIADESAFWSGESSTQTDSEILNSLRPSMAQFPQRLLLLMSSPWAKRGEVHRLHREYFGRDDAPVLVWQARTDEMNPTLPLSVIEQARARDPVMAMVEYDAGFMPDITSAFDPERIEAAVDTGVRERAPAVQAGTQSPFAYKAFVDPAGGSGGDSYTAAIAHANGELALLDALLEVRPPFDTDAVSAQVAALCKRYSIAHVVGDHYAGDWPKQALAKYGIGYNLSERPKSEIYVAAVPLFSSGRVRLLDNDRLIHQLRTLDRRAGRGGRDSIDHPRGGNDDAANAACGALVLCARGASVATGEVFIVQCDSLMGTDAFAAFGYPGDIKYRNFDV